MHAKSEEDSPVAAGPHTAESPQPRTRHVAVVRLASLKQERPQGPPHAEHQHVLQPRSACRWPQSAPRTACSLAWSYRDLTER